MADFKSYGEPIEANKPATPIPEKTIVSDSFAKQFEAYISQRASTSDRAANNSFVFQNPYHPHPSGVSRQSNRTEIPRTFLTQGDKAIANASATTLDTFVSVPFHCWIDGNLRQIDISCTSIPKELQ